MTDCLEVLKFALESKAQRRDFDVDTDLFEAGILDSLSFNEFLSEIETSLNAVLDLDTVADWRDLRTLAGIARHICENDPK
jgi:acyl carrier protein